MQTKLNCIYLFYFLLIFLLPFSLLANDSPLEYRGLKLGMSIEEIDTLESVKTGFMPDPRNLDCSGAEYVYSILSDQLYISKERVKRDKKKQSKGYLYAPASELFICQGNRSKRFKLKGTASLYSDNIRYYFYKNKLYRLGVTYFPRRAKHAHTETKNTLNNDLISII